MKLIQICTPPHGHIVHAVLYLTSSRRQQVCLHSVCHITKIATGFSVSIYLRSLIF